MGVSFFAPFLLGGIALLAVPWLVHHIRRPERETIPFGSLMFVPKTNRKVIERQSLQHLLLMLLRMGVLVLLALAFSRPYFSRISNTQNDREGVRHLFLMDISASMNAGNRMQAAKQHALRILNEMESGDRAALAVFDRKTRILVPFDSGEEGESFNPERIAWEIGRMQAGYDSTAYLPALQKAQEILLEGGSAGSNPDREKQYILHVVGDFQKTGIPDGSSSWKLAPFVKLECVNVGSDTDNRFSLTDVGIRKNPDGKFLITGLVKNVLERDEAACRIRLYLKNMELDAQDIAIPAGYTAKISFTVSKPSHKGLSGWMEVGPDDFPVDDRRYFVWNAPHAQRVWLVSQEDTSQEWPASWFVLRALQVSGNRDWEVVEKNPQDLLNLLDGEGRPEILLCCGLNGLDRSSTEVVLRFIREGGSAFMMLDEAAVEDGAKPLFSAIGLRIANLRASDAASISPDAFAWLDFDHPIFFPFRGAKLNDFTSIRFMNFCLLEEEAGNENPVRILARFEDSRLAIAERDYGRGKILLWAFVPHPAWTNLPQSPRFVPLLLESMKELAGNREIQTAFLVGEAVSQPPQEPRPNDSWVVIVPGEGASRRMGADEISSHPIGLFQPGFLIWQRDNRSDDQWVYAVNPDKAEIDLTSVPLDAFRNTFVSSFAEGIYSGMPGIDDGRAIRREWGRWLFLVLLLGLAVETVYASRLSGKPVSVERE